MARGRRTDYGPAPIVMAVPVSLISGEASARQRRGGLPLTGGPQIRLVRANGRYWVLDGNDLVARAREQGRIWIDAEVTALDLVPARDAPGED